MGGSDTGCAISRASYAPEITTVGPQTYALTAVHFIVLMVGLYRHMGPFCVGGRIGDVLELSKLSLAELQAGYKGLQIDPVEVMQITFDQSRPGK